MAKFGDNVVRLSTGHVFVRGSVTAISPYIRDNGGDHFTVHGVGFEVKVWKFQLPRPEQKRCPPGVPFEEYQHVIKQICDDHYEAIRQEFVEKLLT